MLGLSRRSVLRGSVFDWFVEPQLMRETIAAVGRNDFSTSRFDALLAPAAKPHGEPMPVHVIVNQMEGRDDVVVELVEIEQQTRQEREERRSSRRGRTRS